MFLFGGVSSAWADTAPTAPDTPIISGMPQDGQTLNVSAGFGSIGVPLPTYSYAWYECDASGNNCSSTPLSSSSSYTLQATDVGNTVEEITTASNDAGSASSTSAPFGPISDITPQTETAPQIPSTAQENSVLDVTPGTFTGDNLTTTYQWQTSSDNGVSWNNITGATNTSYTPTANDVGNILRVVETASNSSGSASSDSNATSSVEGIPPGNITLPQISGTPQAGQTLSESGDTWSGSTPQTYTYQWQDCNASGTSCTNITGATSKTYQLQTSDIGLTVEVTVQAANSGGESSATSSPTAIIAAAPPLNTSPPTISGTAQDSQTLTANVGSWTGTQPITYTYQWQDCNSSGTSCVNITSATNQTYQVQSSDVGHTIDVIVQATNSAGNTSATSSSTAVVTGVAPVSTHPPTISGVTRDGQTLSESGDTWSGSTPQTYTYQWQDCNTSGTSCVNITGATNQTYTLASSDIGHTIVVQVTATNSTGQASASSAATSVVTGNAPQNTHLPVISGTAQDGQTLSESGDTWSGSTPQTYTYQWQDCNTSGASCVNITGASYQTYTLSSSDIGHTIVVVVTATNSSGQTQASSAATVTVLGNAPSNTHPPIITGTTRDGQTLSESGDTWSGSTPQTYTYQWQDCNTSGAACVSITGATNQTYTLASSDVGHTIVVVVTATNSTGSAQASSAATSVIVGNAPSNTHLPTITGNAQDGQTLSESGDTWSGSTPQTYTYQWQDCNTSGTACSNIAGATASSYTLSSSDIGHTIVVQVTATNTAGSATASSAATSVIGGNAPQNTHLPVIGGTARDGQTLSESGDTWSGSTPQTYTYQWQDCNASGASCANITSATKQTYVLTSSDIGHTIVVQVTATNSTGQAQASSAATAVVTGNAPQNTHLPVINGTARDGQTLSESGDAWSGSTPQTYTYQWQDCNTSGTACVNITGATNQTYTLASSDIGHTIVVQVKATNSTGSAQASSAATPIVTGNAPQNTQPPMITGTLQEGQTLTESGDTWSGSTPQTYTYQWQDCNTSGSGCSNITGATKQTYTLTAADIGHTIVVEVTATNSTGQAQASSAATAVVGGNAPQNTHLPVISGNTQSGQTLTESKDTWSGTPPITYSYQWQDCNASGASCINIAGATSQTYQLQNSDIGSTIVVIVTATNGSGSSASASAPTATVGGIAPKITRFPNISGIVQQGQPLTESEDAWSGSTPISYSYQWLSCDVSGNNCAVIAGASSTVYTLQASDVGHTIRVSVTASNSAGSATATSSQTPAVVALPPAPCTTSQSGMSLTFTNPKTNALVISYGAHETIRGTLKGPGNKSAVVTITSGSVISTVTTNSKGQFIYHLPVGTSRALTFFYMARSTDCGPSARAHLAVKVKPVFSIHASVSHHEYVVTGKLIVGPLPKTGAVVEIQAQAGSGWVTLYHGKEKVKANHSFSYHSVPLPPGQYAYRFRVFLPTQANMPYLASPSNSTPPVRVSIS